MTVSELRELLGRLPQECDGMPVGLFTGSFTLVASAVCVYPPRASAEIMRGMVTLCFDGIVPASAPGLATVAPPVAGG